MPRVAPPLTGTFTGTGNSATYKAYQGFNVSLWGTFVATIKVQRSFDGGTTWITTSLDSTGTPASFTSEVTVTGNEIEAEVLYRFSCTAYSSGTVNYRLSQ